MMEMSRRMERLRSTFLEMVVVRGEGECHTATDVLDEFTQSSQIIFSHAVTVER